MVTADSIFKQVREILHEDFGLDDVELSNHLIDDLDFDSIDSIELAVRLESVARIEVEEDELKGLRTVGDIVDLVLRHSSAEEGGGA